VVSREQIMEMVLKANVDQNFVGFWSEWWVFKFKFMIFVLLGEEGNVLDF
jgi:hypothetical protein